MKQCEHAWTESYYGHECTKCGAFAAHGCAPWDIPTDEEQARIDKEEYYYTHGTCETCGGEWGDGWSTCQCGRPYVLHDRQIIGRYLQDKFSYHRMMADGILAKVKRI